MELAEKWVQPTAYTGNWPDWAGYTWLDYHKANNVYHPADDYNLGWGDQDLGQNVASVSAGKVIYTSKSSRGYGNIIVIKHQLGYKLKRFIKETYGIDTDVLYSFYAHLKDIIVAVGNTLEAGAKIGSVGKSGTKLAHLHHEIYAPIGDLKNKSWRFYPTGWSKEEISKYWIPPYKFIEATKQIDDLLDTYLGKSKEYWLQVEKDRESLMKQISECDDEWLEKLKVTETKISNLKDKVLEMKKEAKKVVVAREKEIKAFNKKIDKLEKDKKELKKRITDLLKDQAENYKFWEAIRIAFYTIKSKLEVKK